MPNTDIPIRSPLSADSPHNAGESQPSTALQAFAAEMAGNKPNADATSGLRILLVDDHQDTRTGFERLLRRSGHHVQAANSKEAALSLAASGKFDLLISDLNLPDGTGYDLIIELRERQPGHGDFQAIAISGFGMEGDLARSKASGFSVHLVKPVEFAQLKAAIAGLTSGGAAGSAF